MSELLCSSLHDACHSNAVPGVGRRMFFGGSQLDLAEIILSEGRLI